VTYKPKDHYFKKAKEEGYVARSAYKLQEIQSKLKILKKGMSVLELGSAPGSWSQVILQIIGKEGTLYGIDLHEAKIRATNFHFLKGDIFAAETQAWMPTEVDVVLSDMAPASSGIASSDQARSAELCRQVIEVGKERLKVGGSSALKIFMGPEFKEIEGLLKQNFRQVKTVRPDSTRKSSFEVFLVAQGFHK